MKKIVFLGFLPDQARILTEALPGIKLKFIVAERKQIQVPRADLVVVWTDFVSHRLSASVVDQCQKDSVLLHRGGIRVLLDSLRKLFPPPKGKIG